MNRRFFAVYNLPVAALQATFCLLLCNLPVFAVQSFQAPNSILNSENIARRALCVASATHSSGRCYAAVSSALSPLGVFLSGTAAYQAEALLMDDQRFVPLALAGAGELNRGDIVVYCRSASHPYGHIAVYEGNNEEASDHIAAATSAQSYGGATVFRLRANYSGTEHLPAVAPDYVRLRAERAPSLAFSPGEPAALLQPRRRHLFAGIIGSIKRNYGRVKADPLGSTLLHRCKRFFLQ